MIFENSFVVSAGVDDAWRTILDVPGISPCFPGASLTEQVDTDTYKGNVSLKLGPVALKFNGVAKIVERDAERHVLVVDASGADAKGRGNAKAVAHFVLVPENEDTRINVSTDLSLTGSVAQYARGTSLIQSVSAALIKEFESRLNRRFENREAPATRATGETQGSHVAATSNAIGPTLLWKIFMSAVRNIFRKSETHE
jgi:uncharacterized protein